MARVAIVLALVALLQVALAQDNKDISPISVCGLKTNRNQFLGYNVKDKQPIYNTYCGGLCISVIQKRTECRVESYEKVSIYKPPYWWGYMTSLPIYVDSIGTVPVPYKTQTIIRPKSCSCKPSRCYVNGRYYEHGAIVYSECGERCTCSYGSLVNCCRIRKNFKTMSYTERRRYVQAVYDISKGTGGATPALKASYDALIADHEANFNNGIHAPDELLPWHRWYILQLENLLRQIDCRITVPYWKWEDDYSDPWGSIIWSGTNDWLGGGTNNNCVPDGPFTSPFTLTPSAGNACLRRRRTGGVPSPAQVATLLSTSPANYLTFNSLIDSMHGGVHCSISGTMCTTESANAPEFFLHHCNMDRLWAKWQDQSSAHMYSFTTGINSSMTTTSLASGIKPWDVMNIYNHLGVCVRYDTPRIISVSDILLTFPADVLSSIPRIRPTYGPAVELWWSMMGYTDEQIAYHRDNYDTYFGSAPELINAQMDPFVDRYGISLDDLEDRFTGWAEQYGETDDYKNARSLFATLQEQISLDVYEAVKPTITSIRAINLQCTVNDKGVCTQ